MIDPIIEGMRLHVMRATPVTDWAFLQIETRDGISGWGEATLLDERPALRQAESALAEQLIGKPFSALSSLRQMFPTRGLAFAALYSAADQAIWDALGILSGMSLSEMLGAPTGQNVRLYANLNRRTHDRSPDGFGKSARLAAAAGFDGIKVAPFDEATPDGGKRGVAAGLRRIQAVREAIGPDVDLMVDCHWRLSESLGEHVIAATSELGLYWLECPLPEVEENIPAIARLRGAANRHGIRLAGLETRVLCEAFSPYLSAGAYDVVMPDVKYVGGVGEMLRLSRELARAGVAFSPHNPSGPVAHAASMHVTAAAPQSERLEVQLGETPLFDDLQEQPMRPAVNGVARCSVNPGLGVRLNAETLTRYQI